MAPVYSKLSRASKLSPQQSERYANDPAIPLKRPKKPKYDSSELVKYKCYHNPEDEENRSEFTISLPIFGGGTPEETLEWLKQAHKVIKGTNMHNPVRRHEFFTSMLTGDVKAVFANKAIELGHRSIPNLRRCEEALITHSFPHKALEYQKRYMRNAFFKPEDWTIRRFAARVEEINNLLEEFPPFNDAMRGEKKMPPDELITIVTQGAPDDWQEQMVIQDFDAEGKDMTEVLTFFDRMAHAKGEQTTFSIKERRTINTKIPRKGKLTSDFNDHSKSFARLYCTFCNKNGHTQEECRHYKKAKMQHSDLSRNKKPYHSNNKWKRTKYDHDSKPKYQNKTWKKSQEKTYSKEEVKMILDQSHQKLLKKYKAPNAPKKAPEVYTVHDTDSEPELGKRKIHFESSDESDYANMDTNHDSDFNPKSSDESESENDDDDSHNSHYGIEDRDSKFFTKKGARKYHKHE